MNVNNLDNLKKWAKEFIQIENKKLNAEYNFLDKIKQNRSNGAQRDIDTSLEEVLVKSLNEFMYS